jgi:hypothetical protein
MRHTAGVACLLAALGCLAASGESRGGQPSSAPATGKEGFTRITRESGVERVLDEKYQKEPKWWLSGLYLVDLDGDGKLDLFLGAHGGGDAIALLNDGNGHFTPAPGRYPTSEIHLPYDINEDGKVDLQMTFQDGGGKWWINESSPGRLSFRETSLTAGQARQNAMIDINRDGKVDWLHERPGIVFELGDGKGGFKKGGELAIEQTRFEIGIFPADLNGDGFIDLVAQWGRYEAKEGKSRILINDGNAGAPTFAADPQAGLGEEGVAVKGVGDVNQDGHLDLIVLERMKPELYLNDGKGKFRKKEGAIRGMEGATRPIYASWGLAVVTDFDNDGIADILWNGRNFLWLLRGTGDGNFVYMNKAWGVEDKSAASVDDGLCFGDIDGDGRLDIIGYTGGIDSLRRVAVYRNDLPARNWIRVRPVGLAGNRGAAGAKIRLHEAGASGRLLWFEQVMILDSQSAHSYYSYAQTERHFGLGQRESVDVSVEFYPSGRKVLRKGVKANSTVEVREDAPVP